MKAFLKAIVSLQQHYCIKHVYRWLEKVDSTPGINASMIDALVKKKQCQPETYTQ